MKYNLFFRFAAVSWLTLFVAACGGGGGGGGAGPAQGGDQQGNSSIVITVTKPSSGNSMETPDPSVILEGTASSETGITSISWVNDRGGQGTASGTSAWKTGGISLMPGNNRITITARDQSGGTASHAIVIKRESAGTGSVELSWSAPTHREDGSVLSNLAGYRIYYGRLSGVYDYEVEIDNPGVTTYVVEGLKPGTWYFVLSAFDSEGLESNFSNEVARKVK